MSCILETSKKLTFSSGQTPEDLLKLAGQETDDGIIVLEAVGLHPEAVSYLKEAKRLTDAAIRDKGRTRLTNEAIRNLEMARDQMVEQQSTTKK